MNRRFLTYLFAVLALTCVLVNSAGAAERLADRFQKDGVRRGIVGVVGLPGNEITDVIDLAKATQLTVYFQSDQPGQVAALRQAADVAGLLGTRLFVDAATSKSLPLAENVLDGVVVAPGAAARISDAELLRTLRP